MFSCCACVYVFLLNFCCPCFANVAVFRSYEGISATAECSGSADLACLVVMAMVVYGPLSFCDLP